MICRILNVARSTAYYREHDRVPVVDEVLAQRIKHLIDAESYLGYRMVWARLRQRGVRINRKAVQRIMQLKGWQCHRRLKKRCSPRVESSPSVGDGLQRALGDRRHLRLVEVRRARLR